MFSEPLPDTIISMRAGQILRPWGNIVGAGACLALLGALIVGLLSSAGATPTPRVASGGGYIYWSAGQGNAVRYGNLDGSGTPQTLFAEGNNTRPQGVAIDPAAGRIYWANNEGDTIRVGNLDGTGTPSTLYTEPNNSFASTVAIDPVAGKIYWANSASGVIRMGDLDGSGPASDLFTGEVVPFSLALDRASGKLYWLQRGVPGLVRVGNADGSGSATTIHTDFGSNVGGLAVDLAAGKLYWVRTDHDDVRVANLDGTGTPSTLFTGQNLAAGVAINPDTGKIYWPNENANEGIRVGNLDGTGTPSTLIDDAAFEPVLPTVLLDPAPSGAGPAISGVPEVGKRLSCGGDAWLPDMAEAQLYRAPRTVEYQWLRNGAELPGVTGASHAPTGTGAYACRATASNQAGSTSETSSAVQVSATCRGLPANVAGTEGDETLTGTSGPDVIQALAGNDVVQGSGGDDLICGGKGDDRLLGGGGNDVLIGGPGSDLLLGGKGVNRLFGGSPGGAGVPPGGQVLGGVRDRCPNAVRDKRKGCRLSRS
jgi:DNA-binding beta-propeller fold protein YncE